jgi:hypothetical protein
MVSWLRPRGLLLISAPVSAGEGIDPNWLGVPMYFGGIGQDETIAALTRTGLIVESAQVIDEDEDGSSASFLWVLGQAPS